MIIMTITGALLALTGTVILCVSAAKHNQTIRMLREQSYRTTEKNTRRQWLQEFLALLFTGCYLIGAIESIIISLDWMLILDSVMFLSCSVFFYVIISEQLDMEKALQQRKLEILRTFVNAIDRKDSYTRGHSEHVYKLAGLLYRRLPEQLRSSVNLTKLLDSALLHDIGKIGISDAILKKTGALTPEEWAVMRSHAREGKLLLDDTCLIEIAGWVLYHHERMDGTGYEGLRGADIPLESRIIAIADTYSALTTNRAYRPSMSYGQAVEIMKGAAGTQLDSELLECFLKIPESELAHND